jgi:hypothetical protein
MGGATFLDNLTEKEQRFVSAYLDHHNPKTFLNGRQSIYAAGYKPKSIRNADVMAHTMTHKPKIKDSIRDALAAPDITELILRGIRERLQDPMFQGWQQTVDFVAKVKGEFAPEKHLNMNLTAEDRDRKYQEVLSIVNGSKEVPETSLQTLPEMEPFDEEIVEEDYE